MTTLHAHSKLRPGVSAPQTVLAARRIRFDVADMVDVKAVHASFAVLARVHFDVRCLQAQGACKLEYLAAKPRKLLDELLAESYLFIRARALRARSKGIGPSDSPTDGRATPRIPFSPAIRRVLRRARGSLRAVGFIADEAAREMGSRRIDSSHATHDSRRCARLLNRWSTSVSVAWPNFR
jgi:hypothetical protein